LEQALEKGVFIEDLYNSKFSSDWKIISSLKKPREGKLGDALDKIEWLWNVKLEPKVYIVLALLSIALSFVIVVGELTILFRFNVALFGGLNGTHFGFLWANVRREV